MGTSEGESDSGAGYSEVLPPVFVFIYCILAELSTSKSVTEEDGIKGVEREDVLILLQ